jgi:hypothetical protein
MDEQSVRAESIDLRIRSEFEFQNVQMYLTRDTMRTMDCEQLRETEGSSILIPGATKVQGTVHYYLKHHMANDTEGTALQSNTELHTHELSERCKEHKANEKHGSEDTRSELSALSPRRDLALVNESCVQTTMG